MSLKKIFAITALLASQCANAAYITIDELGLDKVFSQSSFGANTVDIRIGAATTLVIPTLLDITTNGEISQIFSQHVGSSKTVNFYYVDTISACGGMINVSYIGCGQIDGPNFVVESEWAGKTNVLPGHDISYSVGLLAHELVHNLGVGHRNGSTNLMNPSITGFGNLNAAEVAWILDSYLIQFDGMQRFIQINPVLIAAAVAVPEPSSIALMFAGLLGIGRLARKRRNSA